MASSNNILSRLANKSNNIAFPMLGLLCFTLLLQKSVATDFALNWSVPSPETHFDQWAQNNRFQIGDSVVFNYPAGQDSVLRVSQDDYTNCNTDAPTAQKFNDGHTAVQFNQSGPFYFISGNKDNCAKNEKMVVIVLADRSQTGTNQTSTPPPSPAPSGQVSPAPATVETPAPESDQTPPPPPPSGAASIFINVMGSIGAVAAYTSFLLF